LELPDGRTLLYDCGRLGGPTAAMRSATAVLWSRGISHLDAVVLSHADSDHYNGMPELMSRMSIGVVYVSPFMFETNSLSLRTLRQTIQENGIPLVETLANDRLLAGDDVLVEVLHPPRRGMIGSDNANSIVLLVEFAGRRILLPGDLEDDGMTALLAERPIDCDVVMAPHHGSLRSEPEEFAAWSSPQHVIVSGAASGFNADLNRLLKDQGIRMFHTAVGGAIRITVDADGKLTSRAWRPGRW
jgi:competence protein ComEC